MPAHKNIRLWFPISFLFVLFALLPAWADDAAIVPAVGGALKPMKQHPSIEMVAERVLIDIFPERAEVDCLFTFKNDGPATTVKMGFPESGAPGDGDDDDIWPEGFEYFETSVDGQRVPVRIEGYKATEDYWERWRVKSVTFAKDQQRVVRVRYGMGLSDEIEGTRSFSYGYIQL